MPRRGRIVTLAVAQVIVVAVAPSFFDFYADFAAVPVALVVAAAAEVSDGHRPVLAFAPLGVMGAVTAVSLGAGTFQAVRPWRGTAQLTAVASHLRCITSDGPGGLIELNALDRTLAQGCPDWVDVTGRTYLAPDRGAVDRRENRPWQRDVSAYLLHGEATFLVRIGGSGLTPGTLERIEGKRLTLDSDADSVRLGETALRS